jgi:hypothetical protein
MAERVYVLIATAWAESASGRKEGAASRDNTAATYSSSGTTATTRI